MMPHTLAFRCPHCGILLTVSVQQAGIHGPCPNCARAIHAPMPAMPTGHVPPFPILPASRPMPGLNEAGHGFPFPVPASQPSPQREASHGPIPIEPRSMRAPAGPAAGNSPRKEKSDPSGQRQTEAVENSEEPFAVKSILLRAVMPMLFFAAAAALVYGVMNMLGPGDKNQKAASPNQAANPADSPSGQPAAEPPSQTDHTASDPQQGSPSGAVMAAEAISLLEQFLKASSLQERVSLIETRKEERELSSTVLASTLPPFRNMVLESQKSFPLENIVDMFFGFEFVNRDGSVSPQTVVVRRRGGYGPRVLADPFLDLYGGGLAAYASKPQDKGRSFHAIVNALPTCNDLDIPDRQKKITLRLSSHENSPRVILAYASRVSETGELISSGNYDLSYGKPKACVVLLGWNTTESPNKPYLEVLGIQAFHWNP